MKAKSKCTYGSSPNSIFFTVLMKCGKYKSNISPFSRSHRIRAQTLSQNSLIFFNFESSSRVSAAHSNSSRHASTVNGSIVFQCKKYNGTVASNISFSTPKFSDCTVVCTDTCVAVCLQINTEYVSYSPIS